MIAVKDDDYIIGDHRGRMALMLVLNAKSGRCVLEKTLIADEPEHVVVKEEQIYCNLGQEPLSGKAFGIDIKPYIKTIETKSYGPIHIFRKLEDGDLTALKKALKAVYSLFESKATVSFLPLYSTNIEPAKGKYAGSYKFKQKGLESFDTMHLHPKVLNDIEFNKYIIAHEWSHGIWYRCVPFQLRAKWLNLYQKRLLLSNISEKELEELCIDVVNYEGGLGDYCKEVGDDHVKSVIKEVLIYFKRYHHMDQRSVELMLHEDSGKLSEIWPTSAKLTEERADISEYSLKNVEEFFAESFANYILGRMLPKDVQKGIDATVKKLSSVTYD
jgi:hypothetical protein